VLVLTGRLTGGATPAAHNYCDQARGSGSGLEIWDRESLVERIAGSLDIGVAGRTEGPLLTLIGAIDQGSITEVQIERFSRRWMSTEADAWPGLSKWRLLPNDWQTQSVSILRPTRLSAWYALLGLVITVKCHRIRLLLT
jgi:hypothetical protein